MKVKKGYSPLESFSLSFSPDKPGLLKLPGHDAKMSLINELFSRGEEAEAKKMFRQALHDITRKLDRILEAEKTGDEDGAPANLAASLLGQEG